MPEAPTAICVLGMSRSGTSLTTRVLNLCGVDLGREEDLLPLLPTNPQGHWENCRIIALNDEILASLGGSWQEPPPMAPGWELGEDLDPIRRRAAELLEQSFAGRPLWGWKDPRNCLTLPFWQRLIPAMRYVICLRNPVEVAASLERRERLLAERGHPPHGVSAERAFDLWLEYVAAAIAHTAGRPRVFVSYEEYFEDWRLPVERLARFAGRDPASLGAISAREIEPAIDERLRHHRASASEAIHERRLPSKALALYLIAARLAALSSGSSGPPAAGEERLAELERSADLYAQRLLAGLHDLGAVGS